MDFHIVSDITIEEAKKAHIADKSVQDKYGVKYHQFWINQEAGTIFCLIEAPDKESCERVHQEAHGDIACKIVEVEGGFYKLFMGESHKLDGGIVLNENGNLDKGYRYVLVTDILVVTNAKDSGDMTHFAIPNEAKNLIRKILPSYNGRELRKSDYSEFISVFTNPYEALDCAIDLQKEFLKKTADPVDPSWNFTFKMGLGGGQPVTKDDEFFEQTIRLSRRLSLIAENSEIVLSDLVRRQTSIDENSNNILPLKAIHSTDQEFLEKLFNITEKNLSDHAFNVEKLGKIIGFSRSQLYRKVTAITGRSPVAFIRDLRLDSALKLIKENRYNLSEIALEIGYNNPSYFSKCFRDKYGVKASSIIA
jgi:AraC-like DNA-binding protein